MEDIFNVQPILVCLCGGGGYSEGIKIMVCSQGCIMEIVKGSLDSWVGVGLTKPVSIHFVHLGGLQRQCHMCMNVFLYMYMYIYMEPKPPIMTKDHPPLR
jgi:hypothetical protein